MWKLLAESIHEWFVSLVTTMVIVDSCFSQYLTAPAIWTSNMKSQDEVFGTSEAYANSFASWAGVTTPSDHSAGPGQMSSIHASFDGVCFLCVDLQTVTPNHPKPPQTTQNSRISITLRPIKCADECIHCVRFDKYCGELKLVGVQPGSCQSSKVAEWN